MISLFLTCAVVIGFATPVSGQVGGRMEVGGQFSAMRPSGSTFTKHNVPFLDVGMGGRFAWIFNDTFAVEAVSDFFPTGRHKVLRGGRKFQMLAGPKLGWRSDRVGLFATTRAGVARIGEGKQEGPCLAIFPPPEGCLIAENRLALEIGGGLEIYPTPLTSLRLDAGDLMTRINPSSYHFGRDGDVAHWLQISAGFGVRF
jgi:hypothetical protein